MREFLNLINQIIIILDKNVYKLPLLLILILFLSAIEISSLIIIGPFIDSIINDSVIQIPKIFQNFFNSNNENSILIFYPMLLIFLFFFKMLFSIIINWTLIKFVLNQQIYLRLKLINLFADLNYKDYVNKTSGEYIRSTTILTEQYSNSVNFLLKIASELILLIITVIFLFFINPEILFFSAFFFISFFFLYDRTFKNKLLSYGKINNENYKDIYQLINEFFNGFKEIKILNKSNFFYFKIKKLSFELLNIGIKSSIIGSSPRFILEFILISLICSILIIYSSFNYSLKDIIPTLSVFALASLRVIPSINLITHSFTKLRFGKNAVNLIFDEIERNKSIKLNYNDPKEEDFLLDFKSLELRNISFSYSDTTKKILNNINFKISQGEFVAIIGKSGSGKTTLIDIILGLLPAQSGSILINNLSSYNYYRKFSSQVTYLPQDFFIINDSVANNVMLGLTDSDERLYKSLQQSNLIQNYNDFNEMINRNVGDKGVKLSGGQKHRVALSRSFFHNRKILILDEISSSLDKSTEKQILKELSSLKENFTIIFVTHSQEVIKYCDKVYGLDKNGNISSLKPNKESF